MKYISESFTNIYLSTLDNYYYAFCYDNNPYTCPLADNGLCPDSNQPNLVEHVPHRLMLSLILYHCDPSIIFEIYCPCHESACYGIKALWYVIELACGNT